MKLTLSVIYELQVCLRFSKKANSVSFFLLFSVQNIQFGIRVYDNGWWYQNNDNQWLFRLPSELYFRPVSVSMHKIQYLDAPIYKYMINLLCTSARMRCMYILRRQLRFPVSVTQLFSPNGQAFTDFVRVLACKVRYVYSILWRRVSKINNQSFARL